MKTIQLDKIKNRCEAINELNKWLNKNVPIIEQWLKDNEYSVKIDGSLYEKDRKALNALIEDRPKRIRAYFKWNKYSGLVLDVDTNYKIQEYSSGGFGVSYHGDIVYLEQTNCKVRPIYKLSQFRAMKTKLHKLKEKHTEIESEINKLKRIVEGR